MPVKNSVDLLSSSNSGGSKSTASRESFSRVESLFLGYVLEDSYLIESVIGKGSSSIVFAATDIRSIKKVAVKILARDVESAGKQIARFKQETRTTRYLRHKNIIEIYSFGIAKNHAYFVMEHLTGSTLQDLIATDKQLDQQRTINILKQVAAALSFAHKGGVVHRDVKPSNILFCDQTHTELKLLDFGISTRLSWDYSEDVFRTPTGELYGTTMYISPEQSKGEKTDQKTDIYSLGCVAYECLTGTTPHTGKTMVDIVLKHQTAEIIPVNQALMTDSVSVGLETIVDKMLRKSLKDRYQSLDILLNDLSLLENDAFNHKKYLTPSKEKPQEKIVKDHSNAVFSWTITILLISMIAAVCWKNDFQKTEVPLLNPEAQTTIFDTTNDPDLKAIKEATNSMLYKMSLPIASGKTLKKYFSTRWKKDDFKRLLAQWNGKVIEYKYLTTDPVGNIELETLDKKQGRASILVDTSVWIEEGPKSARFLFKRETGKWLIDDIQSL